ncbi:grasp-with-spasm system SPASM domain peptide maturase [Chryseobacterium fluminis]|uniref:grasp-with-spasm system SPASM domain peptide maturase n=1 Tax=Chryseobacterium fluminis TaxID=2983606 RepID=UPI002259565E|nr:grasp-with-spasm system SPASM domain peptide maturase [Chryseobacterium sp. MMS21-Ot14]UZT98904.1 grasp-with-spasm system SPASM domain peptide maturase [Chryseobacterium sp. MMS21-Ot14]
MSKKFYLHKDCFIVNGIKYMIICDTFNEKYVHILKNMAVDCTSKTINKNTETVDLISFLEKEHYGSYNKSENVLDKDLIWFSPRIINEVIVACSKKLISKKIILLNLIGDLNNQYLQLRFNPDFADLTELEGFLELFNSSAVRTIELMLYYNNFNQDLLQSIVIKYSRVQVVFLYNAPENNIYTEKEGLLTFVRVKNNVINEKFCGLIEENYFSTDLKTFSKSNLFNSCLKEKLYIDENLNFRTCPALQYSYGNLLDVTKKEVFEHPLFNRYRNITKDKIEVCKDCEFRYICTDCRAYTERTHINEGLDISKPLKCGYDPYTGEWEEWSTNPLKQKAIKHYELENFI